MTEPSTPTPRKRAPRRSGAGAGQWMLLAVIVLSVLGTGLWVFSDDRRFGLVALILLVWGLVIAAFLIARYTRDLRAAESKEHGLKTVYELQLEREISARREYELQVEHDIRSEVRSEANEELTALKAEVLALRANLEELLGRDLGPSYSELYSAAERRAIAAQQAKADFEVDDRARAHLDFASFGEPAADIDDYYGATSVSVSEVTDRGIDPNPQPSPVDAETRPPMPTPNGARSAADESPTTVFHVVDDVEPIEPVQVQQPAQARPEPVQPPVDVEHVHIDPTTNEPFVPLAPQSGYRSPLPPRPYTPDPHPAAQDSPQAAPAPEPNHGASAQPEAEQPAQEQSAPAQPDQASDDSEHAPGQHTSGSTVAELIARMNSDTQRTTGGRRRKPE